MSAVDLLIPADPGDHATQSSSHTLRRTYLCLWLSLFWFIWPEPLSQWQKDVTTCDEITVVPMLKHQGTQQFFIQQLWTDDIALTTSLQTPFRIYYTWIWVILPVLNGSLSVNSVALICAENTCVCEKQWFSSKYRNICYHKEIHQKLLSSLGQSSLL